MVLVAINLVVFAVLILAWALLPETRESQVTSEE
jgi:hypothetical protein